jgi:hypothetical protein
MRYQVSNTICFVVDPAYAAIVILMVPLKPPPAPAVTLNFSVLPISAVAQ